jgi:hypothetical protein
MFPGTVRDPVFRRIALKTSRDQIAFAEALLTVNPTLLPAAEILRVVAAGTRAQEFEYGSAAQTRVSSRYQAKSTNSSEVAAAAALANRHVEVILNGEPHSVL